MIDDPDRPAWTNNFFVGMPAPGRCHHGAAAALRRVPRPAAFAIALTWITFGLHARGRLADGVAAAGILRQAGRNPGSA